MRTIGGDWKKGGKRANFAGGKRERLGKGVYVGNSKKPKVIPEDHGDQSVGRPETNAGRQAGHGGKGERGKKGGKNQPHRNKRWEQYV